MKFTFDGPDAVRREFGAAFEHEQRMRAILDEAGFEDVGLSLRRQRDASWTFMLHGDEDRRRLAAEKIAASKTLAQASDETTVPANPTKTQSSETVTIKTDVKGDAEV